MSRESRFPCEKFANIHSAQTKVRSLDASGRLFRHLDAGVQEQLAGHATGRVCVTKIYYFIRAQIGEKIYYCPYAEVTQNSKFRNKNGDGHVGSSRNRPLTSRLSTS